VHTLHGRALAVATGVRLGNHELKVICAGGDGDGYGIGGNHFLHTMRRNVDLTYIVMDNQIYGLTTGQCSPTSVKGMKTKSTPHGSVENPINPIPMAIVGGATYVARAFSGKQKHMVEMFKGAIQHKGFALVDVFSPCVTYNKDNTYQWFNPRVKILEEQGHNPTDFNKAIERGYQWGDEIPIGLFWKRAFDSIEAVIEELRKGRMVIVVDDADRENEGDLIMAAEHATPETVNFMAKHGRGLICVPTTAERLQQLGIERMVSNNRETFKTDFQ